MSTGDSRSAALDGLRGVAVLLVVLCHSNYAPVWAAGSVGVTVFFTLSGFLITSLLLREYDRTGRISFAEFYRRRALRLLPAMLTVVAVVTAFQLAVGVPVDALGVVMVVFYLGNYVGAAGLDVTALSHTWSLAIEEQFYIVWPVVLVLMLRRFSPRALAAVAVGGIVAANVVRLLVWDGGAGAERIYAGSDTRADAMLVGCLVAILVHSGRVSLPPRWGRPAAGVAVAGIFAAGLSTGFGAWVGVPTAVPWLTAVVLVAVAGGASLSWFTARWLVLVGQRSYGLYLWHVPVLWFLPLALASFGIPAPLAWLVGVAASWLITLASWRFVEEPFLRLKDRQRVPARSVVAVTPQAALLR